MANKKDSVIFYQRQIKICKQFLSMEQFGRLMEALFDLDDGGEPQIEDDKMVAMAFAFMSLQQQIDKEKYDKIVERNRKNGAKGGRPKKNPENPNGFFKNPNDNDNEKKNDKRMMNDNDNFQHSVSSLGSFENVELTETEYFALKSTYERTDELIDKVSIWLRGAEHEVPDHYALCVKFATNDKWPRRKEYVPPELPEVNDPIDPEEQSRLVAEMQEKLNGALKSI